MAARCIGSAGYQTFGVAQSKASSRFTPALRNSPSGDPRTGQSQARTGRPASDVAPRVSVAPKDGGRMQTIEDYIQHQAHNLPWWQRNAGCLTFHRAGGS